MKQDDSQIHIKVTLLGIPGKDFREYTLVLDADLEDKKALEEIKRSVAEKGIDHHYQLLVNGKFAHTQMKKDLTLRDGDDVKIIPVLGGG